VCYEYSDECQASKGSGPGFDRRNNEYPEFYSVGASQFRKGFVTDRSHKYRRE
jgi:hypothetical protein